MWCWRWCWLVLLVLVGAGYIMVLLPTTTTIPRHYPIPIATSYPHYHDLSTASTQPSNAKPHQIEISHGKGWKDVKEKMIEERNNKIEENIKQNKKYTRSWSEEVKGNKEQINRKMSVEEITNRKISVEEISKRKKVIEEVKRRKDKIDEVCLRHHNTLRRFNNHQRLLFDTKHHLAYCRNAKAGTTNWLSTLLGWAGVDTTNLDANQIHQVANQVFPPLGGVDAAREMDGATSFTTVRHPFTRLVSAYRDKMTSDYNKDVQQSIIKIYRGENKTNFKGDIREYINTQLKSVSGKTLEDMEMKFKIFQKQEIIGNENINREHSKSIINRQNLKSKDIELSKMTEHRDPSVPSFREFANYASELVLGCNLLVNSACMDQIDVHWQPLYNRCAVCDIHYDVIAKMETFEEDQQLVMALAGINSTQNHNHHNNHSPGPPTHALTAHYLAQLTPFERLKLYAAYYFDFELFGYSPDDVWM